MASSRCKVHQQIKTQTSLLEYFLHRFLLQQALVASQDCDHGITKRTVRFNGRGVCFSYPLQEVVAVKMKLGFRLELAKSQGLEGLDAVFLTEGVNFGVEMEVCGRDGSLRSGGSWRVWGW